MSLPPRPELEKSWRWHLVQAQGMRCLICDQQVFQGDASFDHFLPKAIGATPRIAIGITWLAHKLCNSRRGHTPPTVAMAHRARAAILALPDRWRDEAEANLNEALEQLDAYIHAAEIILGVEHEKGGPDEGPPVREERDDCDEHDHIAVDAPI